MRYGLRFLTLASLLLALTACRPPERLRYPNESVENTAQAWSDAFNRGERGQLTLLVHPSRRPLFAEHELDVKQQIERYDIARWSMGGATSVEGREGREVVFEFQDGAVTRQNLAVLVHDDGRWWIWKY